MRHHPHALPSAWPIAGGHVTVALVVGTLAHAGVARHVTALARTLSAGRHRVRVYVLAEPIPAGVRLLDPTAVPAPDSAVARLQALGIPVTLVPRRRSWEPTRVVALARALRQDAIDVVHAILPAAAAYGTLAARLARVPVVVVSSRAGDPRADGQRRRVLHRVYQRATVLVANTRAQAHHLASEAAVPVERVRVVYDGVDLSRHVAPGRLDGLRDRVWHRPLLIGGAGDAAAGWALFCATAARIAARHPEAHFVWLDDGDPPAAGVMPTAPRGLPLTVVPVADDPDPVLAQLAMLCFAGAPACPTLGLVPAAMAAGRPVVASEVPGISELITDGATGAVVPAGDAGALAEAAMALLEDRNRLRTVGQAARAHAERAFGADTMGRATAALYEASLIGQPDLGAVDAILPDRVRP
jgi:glycosyltransferase involved in cell wall biosynthesis